jgi:membrane protein
MPLRAMAPLRAAWRLTVNAVNGWINDRAPRKGAALAFYTVFSLAPVLLIAITVAGIVFGEAAARGEIVEQIGALVGPEGAMAVEAMILNVASRPDGGFWPTMIGIGTLLVGATTALAELKDGMDQIWRAPPERTSGFMYTIRSRLLSLGLVLALGFLLMVSLVLSASLTAITRYVGEQTLGLEALRVANFVISFGLITVIFAALFKFLPAVRIAWGDVWVGAIVTALLFNVGKFLIGFYLGNSAVVSTYGAAGSLILVLMWVYFSAQIFLLGAEFTKFYAYEHGSRCDKIEKKEILDSAEPS